MRALILAAILLAGCATPATPEPAARSPGEDAASWSFTSTEGALITSSSPARNATMLFFMATWCSSCRSKAPLLAEVAKEYEERGVATYSLDFDATETPADLRAWMDRYDQRWPHGIDEGLRIQRHYEVRSQSSVVVLDGDAEVVKLFGYGQVTGAELRAALEDALSA